MIKYNRKEVDEYYNNVVLPRFTNQEYSLSDVMFTMVYLKLCESQLGLETILTAISGETSFTKIPTEEEQPNGE